MGAVLRRLRHTLPSPTAAGAERGAVASSVRAVAGSVCGAVVCRAQCSTAARSAALDIVAAWVLGRRSSAGSPERSASNSNGAVLPVDDGWAAV